MKRIGKWFALLGVIFAAGGCQVGLLPAKDLFGGAGQSPKLIVKKTLCGFYAEAGTDFNGHLVAEYNPDTKVFKLDGTVSSDAGSVLDKYPAWIGSMAEIRKAEIEANIEINKIQAMKFQAVADTARALGQAGVDVVKSMIPMLAGSSVSATTPWGGLTGTLGTPQPIVEPPGSTMVPPGPTP
jgi:hypothetical protein